MNLAFLGCCALAVKDGTGPIADLPDHAFKRTIGKWEIELDGKSLQVRVSFNGWPAGVIDPNGGIIAAGEIANEDTFIEAVESDLGLPIEKFMSMAGKSKQTNDEIDELEAAESSRHRGDGAAT